MKEFRAKTLEEAYEKATIEFQCSITDLKIDIIQTHSKGLFGLFTKEAIIFAKHKKINKIKSKNKHNEVKNIQVPQVQTQQIFGDFYNNKDRKEIHRNITIKKDNATIIQEIQTNLDQLFSYACYKLDKIHVSFYDETTIYIEFTGEDAALLIGKEGYRYKALSYILFNWIHEKYNLMVRLEVAKFLITQEEAVCNYLEPIIQTIKEEGFAKTKPLDGVLVHIALKKLREEFPDKYVAVKTNAKGDRYILVNEYNKK
jgi:spoIIIJ-associated protein